MDLYTRQRRTMTLFTPFHQIELLRRIRGEFREMPGIRLSLEQAMRPWSLERATCVDVLNQLRSAKFLDLDRNGRYRLAHGSY